MSTRHWLFGVMVAATSGAVIADVDVSGKEFARFVRIQAQGIPGSHVSVGRNGDGAVKWAGIWMKRDLACTNGGLSNDGRHLMEESSRFAADHDARLILFAPSADASAMVRETQRVMAKVEVRGNDMMGEHCYLVIHR